MKKAVKPKHVCTRFVRTGRMQMYVGHMQITRGGKTTSSSVNTETTWWKCLDCGKVEEKKTET